MAPPVRLQRERLVGSKWTAVQPREREKHFVVLRWVGEGDDPPQELELEALLTLRLHRVPWRALADREHWLSGWR
ncbi:TIGR02450 family Trp-rich protein [Corallococcus terminator]|uniref:TIGR02450 family Trp-rich protein n=1 Tax=Corallococcus terminator TaxID=2316733 RepID=UPI001ABF92DF|nr:TIGR02450 family Trp-rich protein [Corallococcus terminator]